MPRQGKGELGFEPSLTITKGMNGHEDLGCGL
jgi:hypothetical protein